MDAIDLYNRSDYHNPRENKEKLHDLTRSLCDGLAVFMVSTLPDSTEKSLAIRNLEEAMMWADAAIARNQTGTTPIFPN